MQLFGPESVNYDVQPVDPYQAMLKGMQFRAVQEAQQAEQEKQARFEEAKNAFFSNPNPTLKDSAMFMSMMSPEQQQAFKPLMEQISEKEKASSLNFGVRVLSALESDPAVGARLLRERAEAEKNSGNVENAQFYEQLAGTAEKSPGDAMKVGTLVLSSIPGSKDALDNIIKSREEARSAELQPLEIEAKKTDIGLGRAQIAESYAGIDLKREQAAASRQLAQKYLAETNKSLKEVAGESGAIPEKDKPDMELKLRKEYNTETKTYKDVLESYRRIEATEDTAVGDISLIFAYMKMLDPASVVREGEQATAQNARGVPDSVANLYNKALSGERLTENQRKQFRSQASKLAEAAKETEKTVRSGLTRISKKYGLDTENIFYDVQPSGDNVNNVPPPPGFTERK